MKLHIKNMVCNRCIIAVNEIFTESGIITDSIKLGEVQISEEINRDKIKLIDEKLKKLGFEIIEDHESQIIERIKNIIIDLVHHSEGEPRVNFSDIIESEMRMNYNYLSNLFSSVEGITIEKYVIHQKIEKAKEYLAYNELTLNEIAFKLGYSSTAHLSNQFKKITGLTPSFFKKIGYSKLKPLDQVI